MLEIDVFDSQLYIQCFTRCVGWTQIAASLTNHMNLVPYSHWGTVLHFEKMEIESSGI